MKFYIHFKTKIGNSVMTLCAGVAEGCSVDSVKQNATDLLMRRHLKNVVDAWIADESGNQKAVLNVMAYNKPKRIGEGNVYEWLTLRSL